MILPSESLFQEHNLTHYRLPDHQHFGSRLPLIVIALFLSFLPEPLCAQNPSPVRIPAWERFHETSLTSEEGGRLLISELNCQSCHGRFSGEVLAPAKAPVLTHAGSRISADHLRRFIASPASVRAGSAMPSFRSLQQGEPAQKSINALVSFLSHGSAFRHGPPATDSVRRGEALFHSVGCAACHADQRKLESERPAFARPLGDLTDKYSISSLTEFLQNPHKVRPSGRMPSLNLTAEESRDVASYLLRDVKVDPNIHFEYFEGSWEQLPDFAALTPKEAGGTTSFTVEAAGRDEMFALRFTGYLHVPEDDEYQFWLRSDDGSRLLIDDQFVIDHDGVHPPDEKRGIRRLTKGPHSLVLEYFELHGGEELSLDIAGGGMPRQSAAAFMSQTKELSPPGEESEAVDASLVSAGRELFARLGCAACHQHGEDAQQITPVSAAATAFSRMDVSKGCLSEVQTPTTSEPNSANTEKNVPIFALSEKQRKDIRAAVLAEKQSPTSVTAEDELKTVMMTLNCYACHQRKSVGGVPEQLNELFAGTIPEMGDEGRLPPHLDGAGDKLNPEWLSHLLNNGAKDRPYMLTRMPKFGLSNMGRFAELMTAADQRSEVAPVKFQDALHRVTADARLMVGDKALSCIKCHDFDQFHATGIRAMDMTTMTKRLRHDWFHRYLSDPQAYRPGTRMPSAWPNGKSVVPKILDGTSATQIEAIWVYLTDGARAKVPSGLQRESIELKPTDHPLIYRNFLEGISPRGIAVGYPEKAHMAWDAEHMTVRLIWHGAFIDASRHWEGRGPGSQAPMGDHVMELPAGPPLAVLSGPEMPWPSESSRDLGFQFRGYQLDSGRRPVFQYTWKGLSVSDLLQAQEGKPDASFLRSLSIHAEAPMAAPVFLRVASGKTIEQREDTWVVENAVRLSFHSGRPIVRTTAGGKELLVPVSFDSKNEIQIQYSIQW